MKQKRSIKEKSQKRKKQRTSKDESAKSDTVKAEVLDVHTLREGMLLLGCVIEIRSSCFLMSLPGCLVGRVPISNISTKYIEVIKNSLDDDSEQEDEASLDSIIEVGAVFPCKVLSVSHEEKKKPSIILSINPKDVNGDLRLSSLYLKMVLHAAVQSIEDHGYVMDIGIKEAQGFLPFSASSGLKNLAVGQVIPTSVRKLPSQKKGNVVWLSMLSFNESFPEVEDENLKLTSILPGTNVIAYITEIKNPFYYAKCMDFDACANSMSFGGSNRNIAEASRVTGTVLYVHPITHMIYLHLGSKPTPNSFNKYFKVKKFDMLKNVKFQYGWHYKLLFKVHGGAMGFVKENEIERTEVSKESLMKNPVVPKARVIFLHYMDNLVHLSFNNRMLESQIVRLEDVQIGDIYEATVKSHFDSRMLLSICVGLSGFVRQIHLSDAFVTMPEKLHPVGSKVQCRVLSILPQSGLNLTCKQSLLNLPPEGVLKSYDQARPDQKYRGVIVHKADTYLLILYFNNVKGVVPSEHIPESSVFFEGQTVTCRVLQCDPVKQRLKLSLMGDKHFAQTLSNVSQNKLAKQGESKIVGHTSEKDQLIDPKKTNKAVIKSITGHQLNVLLDGGLIGRVHITELGCSEENSMPLKQYTAGKRLKVHVIGTNSRRSCNYLEISHRNMKHFSECSFEYPPPVPLEKDFCAGMSVLGFVKEVGTTSASIWLSPSQIGTLDYLHFDENPKVLRKLKKKLKVGLSLTVGILEVEMKSENKGGSYSISLTKIGKQSIKAGHNVVGLVQVACPEKGLILKLPRGYHGVVCLTDLQDVYSPAKVELEKCHKLGFILCHVLEVNHATKFCHLSLRKSRLYSLQGRSLKGIQPELTVENVEQGKTVKGFVKMACDSHFIVNFGRMLDGKVSLHKCSAYGCSLCKHSQRTLKKYSVGDVIEVVIEGTSVAKGWYPLSLPEFVGLGVSEHSRLNLTEDIDWDEV